MTHLLDMKRNILSLLLAAGVLLTLSVACHDPNVDPDPEEIVFTYGAYFLNAGATDNSELTQLNTLWATVNPSCFSLANKGKKLGEGGSDIHVFGQKMYVALSGSGHVSVINKNNCMELGTFSIRDDAGNVLTPSHLADFEGSLLVSLAEGYVARVDTVSFQVNVLQKIGESGGCMAVANQKLYVSNPSAGSIQMLNPVDLHVMKDIAVQKKPRSFTVGSDKNLYCVAGWPETALFQIVSDTDAVVEVTSVQQPQIAAAGPDKSLIVYSLSNADETGGKYYVVNLESLKVEGEFIRDGSYVLDPTGVFIDLNTGNVYISQDGTPGDFGVIYIYTSYGQFLSSFNTGNARTVGAVFITGK